MAIERDFTVLVNRYNLGIYGEIFLNSIDPLTQVKITYSRHAPVNSPLTVTYYNTVHISNNGSLMNFNFIHHTLQTLNTL